MKYKSSDYCPNCHFPLPYKAKFCTHCGQKHEDGIMSLGALLKQVWFRVLHLESKSLLFLWQMFIPGYVAQEFFAGRRKRYPHPIRFFFIVAFLFLFTLNHLTDVGNSRGIQATSSEKGIQISGKKTADKNIDLYELGRRSAEFEKMRREFDSLPPELRTTTTMRAVDTLLQRTYGETAKKFSEIWTIATDSSETRVPDSTALKLGFKSIRILSSDLFLLDANGIIDKYKITDWKDKLLVKQGIKTIQNPSALMKAYLSSLAWTLLVLIGLMAAVLTLLYWRQKRYYVEHFIFLINEHTSMFLLLMFAFWINAVWPLKEFWVIPIVWLLISPLFAMKRFYGQGWGMTSLKSLVFSFAYLVGFVMLFVAAMLTVFLFF